MFIAGRNLRTSGHVLSPISDVAAVSLLLLLRINLSDVHTVGRVINHLHGIIKCTNCVQGYDKKRYTRQGIREKAGKAKSLCPSQRENHYSAY